MKETVKKIHRWWLRQRISMLRADIAVVIGRVEQAHTQLDSMEEYLKSAHRRLRSMRANLALMESPDVLLNEALRK